MSLEQLRGKLFYQGLLLGAVALLTSAALALAAHVTEADIKAAEAADLKQSLTQVLPGDLRQRPAQRYRHPAGQGR